MILVTKFPVDGSYRYIFRSSIQKKRSRRQAYRCNNVISHIFYRCRNYDLCKNNVVIDSETKIKLKRALAEIISKFIKDELTKNKPHANVTSTIMEKVNMKFFQKKRVFVFESLQREIFELWDKH